MKKLHPSLRTLVSALCIIAGWKILALVLATPALPSPEIVFTRFVTLAFTDKLFLHLLATMGRTLAGVLIASVFALPLGILAGRNHLADSLLTPGFYLLFPLPKIALLPVIFLLFGIGELSRVLIVALVLFFQIVLNLRDAAREIPEELEETMDSLGAKGRKKLWFLFLPAVLPAFFTSLRIGIGTALAVLFFAETFFTNYGLGYFTMDSWMRINYTDMYSGIVGLSILGWGLFGLMDFLQRRLCP